MERFSPLLQNLELKKRAGEKEKENIKNKATFLKQDKKTKQNYISCQKKGVSSLSKRNDQEIKRKRY